MNIEDIEIGKVYINMTLKGVNKVEITYKKEDEVFWKCVDDSCAKGLASSTYGWHINETLKLETNN